MSDPREPAPLAPPEDEGSDSDTEANEGVAVGLAAGAAGFSCAVADESTPLPPALPYHIADPTGWSIEKLVPVEAEPAQPEDEATIPEHSRGTQTLASSEGDAMGEPTEPTEPTEPRSAVSRVESAGSVDPADPADPVEHDDEQTSPRARVPVPGAPR